MKPHNLAYDVRNVMRLFDFGLAKELLQKDLVEPPNGYEATGMTGSRRYMAPEVCLCQPYGLPADVYSYGILFWQVCALKIPYDGFTTKQHVEKVILKGERPKKIACLSKPVNKLMQRCWHADPNQRPTFVEICNQLQSELQVLRYSLDSKAIVDRSIHLWNKSLQSESDFVIQSST
jgi:serine/threonine-protein kinase TNNI3K